MPITHKRCAKCQEDKPLDEFYKSKSRSNPHKRSSWCKVCTKAKASSNPEYSENWRAQMQEDIDARTDRGLAFLQMRLWHSAKQRAAMYGVEFSLEKADIVIPAHCPVLKIPLVASKGTMTANSPTLDRLDPTKGYVVGNVSVISNKANVMKSNATIEEVRALLQWMESQE